VESSTFWTGAAQRVCLSLLLLLLLLLLPRPVTRAVAVALTTSVLAARADDETRRTETVPL
jgi:hypothetical protein